MSLTVTAFLQRYAELFSAGRLAEMAGMHAYPCPVQIEERLVVLRGPDDMIEGMGRHHRLLADRGATGLTLGIAAIELPRAGRFRVWARHAHRVRPGASGGGTHAIYYLHRHPDRGLVIEMVDVTHLATRDIKPIAPTRAALA